MLEPDPEDVTTKTLGQVNKYCPNKRDTLKKLGCSLLILKLIMKKVIDGSEIAWICLELKLKQILEINIKSIKVKQIKKYMYF